jgi:hypothetical protein
MLRFLKEGPRKWLWLVLVFLLAAGLSIAIVFLNKTRTPFNRGLYERITVGMAVADLSRLLDVAPGCYDVSPDEKFVNMRHEGVITFGDERTFQEVEKETGILEYFSRQTGKPVAGLRKWVNDKEGIFILTKENNVIGKMYVVPLTAFNRNNWFADLRRKVGL